jgi:hypothetical protein
VSDFSPEFSSVIEKTLCRFEILHGVREIGSQLNGLFQTRYRYDLEDEKNLIVLEEKMTPPAECGCKSNVISELASAGVIGMLVGNICQDAITELLKRLGDSMKSRPSKWGNSALRYASWLRAGA